MIWRETLRDFWKVLQESGAFNDVRLWYLRDQAAGKNGATSSPEFVLESEPGARISTKFVAGSGTTRLVLFATHGSSLHWTNGRYAKLLSDWVDTSSVALLNLLSEPDRKRTILGDTQGVCSTFSAGLPTAQLNARRFWWTTSDDLPAPFVPMLGLDPRSVYRFAKMQMGLGGANPVVFLDSSRIDANERAEAQDADYEQIVSALSVHSPEAFRLARFLCLSPFTLPVARLVQETILGRDSSRDVLGRLILSGLVRTTKESDDVERTYFEFFPRASEILLRSLRTSESEAVAAELEARVSQYIEKTRDRVTRDVVRYPDESGISSLPDFVTAFARVSRALLGDPQTRSDLQGRVAEFTSRLRQDIVAEVRTALIQHQNIPLDPDGFDADVWKALVETDLVWQSGSGEWRLRVGVAEDLGRPDHESKAHHSPSSDSGPKTITRFAIVINAANVPGMPYIARAESDASNFVAWLREIGLTDDRIILKDADKASDIVAASDSLLAQARAAQGHRQLFFYFVGHGVVSVGPDLYLRVGSTEPFDLMLATTVAHFRDSRAFDDLVFVVDVVSVPLLGIRHVSRPSLAPSYGSERPNLLAIVADGQMHESIAPRSFTAEVLEALRTADATRYVSASAVEDRIYRRLTSEVRIEREGDDFNIWGPVTGPRTSRIESVWVVTNSSEMRDGLAVRFKVEDRPWQAFPIRGKIGVMQVNILSESEARQRLPIEQPDVILSIMDVGRARPSKEWNSSLLMVAGSINPSKGEQIAAPERLLRTAGWITETGEWIRNMRSIRMPSTPEVTFGTISANPMSDAGTAGNASEGDLEAISEISFQHPQLQFFAIGAWRSGPREVSQVSREAAVAFATSVLKRLNEEETGAPRDWSFTRFAKSRLEEVQKSFSPPVSGRINEYLGYIAQYLSLETAPTEAWATTQLELASVYGRLAEWQSETANLTTAIAQCRLARGYYERSSNSLGRARVDMDIGFYFEKRGSLTGDLNDLDAAAKSFGLAFGGFPEQSNEWKLAGTRYDELTKEVANFRRTASLVSSKSAPRSSKKKATRPKKKMEAKKAKKVVTRKAAKKKRRL